MLRFELWLPWRQGFADWIYSFGKVPSRFAQCVFCRRAEVTFSMNRPVCLVTRVDHCDRDFQVDSKLQDNGISALGFPYRTVTLTRMVRVVCEYRIVSFYQLELYRRRNAWIAFSNVILSFLLCRLVPGESEHSKLKLKKKRKTKLRGFGPRANYTGRATAACWRNECLLLRIEGVAWSAQRFPTVVNLGFLDRSRYFFLPVAPQLSSRG
jgi:hypothetical protein